MTVNEMLTELGYRLDDPNEERYTSDIKLSALNSQQEWVASVAHPAFLKRLHSVATLDVPETGVVLPDNYLRYVNAELYNLGKWITRIDVSKVGMTENQYFGGNDHDPLCYVYDNVFYLLVDTYSGDCNKVHLYYIRKPATLAVNGVCELDEALHPILLDLAESSLRITYKYGDFQEARELRDRAEKKLYELNALAETGRIM